MNNKLLKFIAILSMMAFADSAYVFAGNKYIEQKRVNERYQKTNGEKLYLDKGIHDLPIDDAYVIHFIIDGTNLETFDEMLTAGKLPNMSRMFVDEGAIFKRGLSLFPSTSATVYQAYTTGLWPGHAGIPHIQRFDRGDWRVVDYLTMGDHDMVNSDQINLRALMNPDSADLDRPTTIFDLLSGHPTAAVYSSFYRGAKTVEPGTPLQALWAAYVSGRENRVDVLALDDVNELYSGEFSEIPRYSLIGLYSSDINGHRYGPKSREVKETLSQFDLYLKSFEALLKERGIYDKTYIVVSADHGMHKTGMLFKFKKQLEAKGIHVKPKNPKDNEYTVFSADRGVVSTHIYVKHDGGFKPIENADVLKSHPTIWNEKVSLIDIILGMDATEFLIVRNGDRKSRVYDHEGKIADIECFTVEYIDYCSYRFDEFMGDPLGYSSSEKIKPLLDGMPHSTFEWRKRSADDEYPDAVMAFGTMFEDGRAGDAFITTRGRYGFRKVKKGNHGGIISGDMRTPFLMRGPKVEKGEFDIIRPVDLYVLATEWLGLEISPKNHDGRNPFRKYAGENRDAVKLAALEELFEENPPIYKMIDVPHFVRTKVYEVVKPGDFDSVRKVATRELHNRYELSKKLKSTLDKMKTQKTDESALEVVNPEYLDDHIDIVARALKRTQDGYMVLEEVDRILEKCKSADSASCQGL